MLIRGSSWKPGLDYPVHRTGPHNAALVSVAGCRGAARGSLAYMVGTVVWVLGISVLIYVLLIRKKSQDGTSTARKTLSQTHLNSVLTTGSTSGGHRQAT